MFLRAINSHVKLVQSNRRSREISLKTDGNFDLPSLVKEQMLLRCFFFLLLHRIIQKFSFQYAFYWQAHLIHLPSVWGKVCIKLEIYASDMEMLQFHSKNKYSLVWLALFIFFFFRFIPKTEKCPKWFKSRIICFVMLTLMSTVRCPP